MNASRSLDSLVAFYVMAFETYKSGWCDCGNGRAIAPLCGYKADVKLGAAPHEWVIPLFSSSLDAAWGVVDHLKAHEFKYAWMFEDKDGDRIAGCKPTIGKGNPAVHKSDSMALSICLAALKAMNVPFENPKIAVREYGALEVPKP